MVGQAPPRTGCPRGPLSGAAALASLSELAGIPPSRFLRRVERRNLLGEYPGPHPGGKGDAFHRGEAQRAADAMRRELAGRRVLLLGRQVAACFGVGYLPFLMWCDQADGTRLAAFPHPSRVSRWWNEERNRRRAESFLRELLGVRA